MGLKNKFETKIYKQLKKAKVKFKYESDKIPYVIAAHYIPDFVVKTLHGCVYIECKGYFRPEHKRKMVAVKKCNPQYDIRIVFYSESKQNIRWCEKNGFKYSIGTIPGEWLQ